MGTNNSYRTTLSELKAAISVVIATEVFEEGYEGAGQPNMLNRISDADQILANMVSRIIRVLDFRDNHPRSCDVDCELLNGLV